MLKPIARLLADCSVGQKLLLGFGLVSVLAVVAIAQGLYATASLFEHGRQVSVMAAVNRLTLQLRNAEKRYALAPSAAATQEVEDCQSASKTFQVTASKSCQLLRFFSPLFCAA